MRKVLQSLKNTILVLIIISIGTISLVIIFSNNSGYVKSEINLKELSILLNEDIITKKDNLVLYRRKSPGFYRDYEFFIAIEIPLEVSLAQFKNKLEPKSDVIKPHRMLIQFCEELQQEIGYTYTLNTDNKIFTNFYKLNDGVVDYLNDYSGYVGLLELDKKNVILLFNEKDN